MDYLQSIIDEFNKGAKIERSHYHLTLGKLIDGLRKVNPEFVVRTESKYGVCSPHSYRGYYSDLALEPNYEFSTIKQVLDELNGVFNKELTGYKGGEYLMDYNTPLWLSVYGVNSNVAIIDYKFDAKSNSVILITKNIDIRE